VGGHVWVAPLLRCTREEVDAEFALFFGAEREGILHGWMDRVRVTR
jgi:hypothetical protein